MDKIFCLHILNSIYGDSGHYGLRSKEIVERQLSRKDVQVYTKAVAAQKRQVEDLTLTIVNFTVKTQLKRIYSKIARVKNGPKKVKWEGFDLEVCRKIKHIETENIHILHTWEWIPRTIELVRKQYPDVKIVRDVVVNRYYEYFSGTPIIEEEPVTDYFFSPSSFSTEKLLTWGIPKSKIFEIPFGVDTELYHPIEGKLDKPLRFSFSGGVSRRKGVDSLLRVWKRLALLDAELHLYGKVRDDVKDELVGAENVVCHGFVSLPELLHHDHIFVFPSTLEGSAKSVYEALACGLPVITTPDSGSVVREGVDGYIVETGNDDQLAEAMLRLYRDPDLRTALGRNARERALEYTWDIYAAQVWQAYNDILQDS